MRPISPSSTYEQPVKPSGEISSHARARTERQPREEQVRGSSKEAWFEPLTLSMRDRHPTFLPVLAMISDQVR